MDLTEAEDITKRWEEYTEELYKKDLHDPDNHDGVITHRSLPFQRSLSHTSWSLGSPPHSSSSSGLTGTPSPLPRQILKADTQPKAGMGEGVAQQPGWDLAPGSPPCWPGGVLCLHHLELGEFPLAGCPRFKHVS